MILPASEISECSGAASWKLVIGKGSRNFLTLLITPRTCLSGTCQHWPRTDPVWPLVDSRRSPATLPVRRRSMSSTLMVVGSECLQGAVNNPHHLSYRQVTPQLSFFYSNILAETLQSQRGQLDPFIFFSSICVACLLLIANIELINLPGWRRQLGMFFCLLLSLVHPGSAPTSISWQTELHQQLLGSSGVSGLRGDSSLNWSLCWWAAHVTQRHSSVYSLAVASVQILSQLMSAFSYVLFHSSTTLISAHQWTRVTRPSIK